MRSKLFAMAMNAEGEEAVSIRAIFSSIADSKEDTAVFDTELCADAKE